MKESAFLEGLVLNMLDCFMDRSCDYMCPSVLGAILRAELEVARTCLSPLRRVGSGASG